MLIQRHQAYHRTTEASGKQNSAHRKFRTVSWALPSGWYSFCKLSSYYGLYRNLISVTIPGKAMHLAHMHPNYHSIARAFFEKNPDCAS